MCRPSPPPSPIDRPRSETEEAHPRTYVDRCRRGRRRLESTSMLRELLDRFTQGLTKQDRKYLLPNAAPQRPATTKGKSQRQSVDGRTSGQANQDPSPTEGGSRPARDRKSNR